MPAEQLSFRGVCGRFAAVLIFLISKRVKKTEACHGYYTRKARSAQVQCVLLTVVLLQILLCAGDIETNPGPDTNLEAMKGLLQEQEVSLRTFFEQHLETRFRSFEISLSAKVDDSLSFLRSELQSLHSKTCQLEQNCGAAVEGLRHTEEYVSTLEDRLCKLSAEFEEKIDRLEASARKDNLKFFNLSESSSEDYEQCVRLVLDCLHNTVPDKVWHPDDVIRAHRVGSRDAQGRPRPTIVQFARWSDKMAILTSGRQRLKQKGVTVAGDLTSKQRETIQQHRRQGLHAYYKGSSLIVTGPLRQRNHHDRSYADAASRDHRNVQHRSDGGQQYHTHPPYQSSGWGWHQDRRHGGAAGSTNSQYSVPRTSVGGDSRDSQQTTRDPDHSGLGDWDWHQHYQHYLAWTGSMHHFPSLPQHHHRGPGSNPTNLQPVGAGVASLPPRDTPVTTDPRGETRMSQNSPPPAVISDCSDVTVTTQSESNTAADQAASTVVRPLTTDPATETGADSEAVGTDQELADCFQDAEDGMAAEATALQSAVSHSSSDTRPLTSDGDHPTSEPVTQPPSHATATVRETPTNSAKHVRVSPAKGGLASRLRSSSVSIAGEKSQLTLAESMLGGSWPTKSTGRDPVAGTAQTATVSDIDSAR